MKYSKLLSINDRRVLWGTYITDGYKYYSFEYLCGTLVKARNIFKNK